MTVYVLNVQLRDGGQVVVRQPMPDDDGAMSGVYHVERTVMARYGSARSVEAVERDGVAVQSGIKWR